MSHTCLMGGTIQKYRKACGQVTSMRTRKEEEAKETGSADWTAALLGYQKWLVGWVSGQRSNFSCRGRPDWSGGHRRKGGSDRLPECQWGRDESRGEALADPDLRKRLSELWVQDRGADQERSWACATAHQMVGGLPRELRCGYHAELRHGYSAQGHGIETRELPRAKSGRQGEASGRVRRRGTG